MLNCMGSWKTCSGNARAHEGSGLTNRLLVSRSPFSDRDKRSFNKTCDHNNEFSRCRDFPDRNCHSKSVTMQIYRDDRQHRFHTLTENVALSRDRISAASSCMSFKHHALIHVATRPDRPSIYAFKIFMIVLMT